LAVSLPGAHHPVTATKGCIMWKELNSREDFADGGAGLDTPSPVAAVAEDARNGAPTDNQASRKRWRLGPMALAALAVCAHPYAGFR
jgi:hypothetical protein